MFGKVECPDGFSVDPLGCIPVRFTSLKSDSIRKGTVRWQVIIRTYDRFETNEKVRKIDMDGLFHQYPICWAIDDRIDQHVEWDIRVVLDDIQRDGHLRGLFRIRKRNGTMNVVELNGRVTDGEWLLDNVGSLHDNEARSVDESAFAALSFRELREFISVRYMRARRIYHIPQLGKGNGFGIREGRGTRP